MEIMLSEISKEEDDLNEYFATSILSVNENMKCNDSLKKYYCRVYWDQISLLESNIFIGINSRSVTSTLTVTSEWCCIPREAEHIFYGHCILQGPVNSLRIEDITAAYFYEQILLGKQSLHRKYKI